MFNDVKSIKWIKHISWYTKITMYDKKYGTDDLNVCVYVCIYIKGNDNVYFQCLLIVVQTEQSKYIGCGGDKE